MTGMIGWYFLVCKISQFCDFCMIQLIATLNMYKLRFSDKLESTNLLKIEIINK